jgi:nephrocystin-3
LSANSVFFSSPFGGMEKEREILTKQYFPELRVLCEQNGLSFVPIDLRWGVF